MIGAQQVVDVALAEAARLGKADETIVMVTDRSDAALRWANNSMTTNGVSVQRRTTVISVVRRGDRGHVASLTSSEVDPAVIPGLVAASQEAALAAPEARDSAPPLPATDAASDWDAPIPGTGVEVFGGVAEALTRGFPRADRLYGFARHILETTFVATSSGLRRRYTQPTGSVEINAKRDGASAWAGVSTPDFVDVPTDSMLEELSTRLGWAQRTVELPAGRYETILPPSAVADLMIYLSWSMDGRGAQEGRTAFSAPGGGTRVGEKLTDLPLTLYSDPAAAGLECMPFVAATSSSERASVFDNGMDIDRVDWIRDGTINALAYPRAAAAEFGVPGRRGGRQPADDRRHRQPGRHGRGHRARAAADHAVVHPRGRPGRAAADRADPRRCLPGRGRSGHRRGQQLPVQREPAGPAAPGQPGRRQRGHAAARMGRLGHPRGDAHAADPGLPHVVGQPGAIMRRCTIR